MTLKQRIILASAIFMLLYLTLAVSSMAVPAIRRIEETPSGPPKLSVVVPKLEVHSSSRAGMGYMVITNNGGEDDRLLSCSLKGVFAKVELHNSIKDGEELKMVPVDSIAIGSGKTVILRKAAYHVALYDLPETLPEKVTLVLKFEKTPTMEVEAIVQKQKAAGTVDMRGVAPNLHHGRCHEQ